LRLAFDDEGNRKSAIGKSKMNRGLHRYILFLAGATFLLLMAGALVTSHDAGLATSDWPRSNGQWFPKMVGNLFWEHGHRMVATTVGLLTVGSASVCSCSPHRVRRLGAGRCWELSAGAARWLTVMLLPLWVSAAHATLAHLFFARLLVLRSLPSRLVRRA
jgi:heme A synthase